MADLSSILDIAKSILDIVVPKFNKFVPSFNKFIQLKVKHYLFVPIEIFQPKKKKYICKDKNMNATRITSTEVGSPPLFVSS